jgi:hypothetical protein
VIAVQVAGRVDDPVDAFESACPAVDGQGITDIERLPAEALMPGPWLNLVVAGRNLRLGKAREQLVDQRLADTATATDNEDLFGFRAQAGSERLKG